MKFPENFKFGVATSSHQIEGAWNEDGKCESIWNYQEHNFPHKIIGRANADIACDSYHKIKEDVANLKQLKVDYYRFSVSWCRILPTGFPNRINDKAINHYNELIDELIKNGIEPVVTIFHWELPQSLEDLGGWNNPIMSDYFVSYARICFKHFGDRVKNWITINEPYQIATLAYGGNHLAPFYNSDGIGSYLVAHGLLLAHAKAYRLYQNEFKELQNGKIGIALDARWIEPYTADEKDKAAAERAMQMHFGWFAHPIFSKDGDYPSVMRDRIDRLSKEQNFDYSRLPKFTPEEVRMLKGSSDFFGLNHYNTDYVHDGEEGAVPSNANDMGSKIFTDDGWKKTSHQIFVVVPWGIRKLLNWVKNEYGNPEVRIMENGFAGFPNESLNDLDRIDYINRFVEEILNALILDKCNVVCYTFWSFMDNFEWRLGYSIKFGLYYVDFSDPKRPRKPKRSAFVFQDIIVSREVKKDNLPTKFLH